MLNIFEHTADDYTQRRVHVCHLLLVLLSLVGHEGASASPRGCDGTRHAPESASSQHHLRPARGRGSAPVLERVRDFYSSVVDARLLGATG